MESGTIKLMPVFTGSAETTAEEMKEYVQEVVTQFCAITGLVVIEATDHEKGAFFVLGEEGKDQGIIIIGNASSANYYRMIIVSRVLADNKPVVSMASASSSVGNGLSFAINQNPTWMKYVKSRYGIVVGFSSSAEPSLVTASLMIQKAVNSLREEMTCLWVGASTLNASYSELLESGGNAAYLFSYGGTNYPIIPADKDAVSDIYLNNNAELCGMKLYTNKKQAKSMNIVTINGKRYVVTAVATPFSLIMEAMDTVGEEAEDQ